MKKCYSCWNSKPLEDFYPDKRRSDGRQSRCIACEKQKYRLSRIKTLNLKERFMYQAVIGEDELDNTSHLTYREILEIIENTLAFDQVA